MCKLSYLSVPLVMILAFACTASPPTTTSNPTIVAGAAATPEVTPAATAVTATLTPLPAPPSATVGVEPTAAPITTPDITPAVPPAGLELSSYAGRPGQSITLRGQGFGPGESVHVEFQGSPATALGDYVADELGRVVAEELRIPTLPEGQYTLVGSSGSGRQVSRVFSIVGFHPWVVLSSYAIHPGESFGFTGSEFVPGEEVQVFLDGAERPVANVQADGQGNLWHQAVLQATSRDVGKHDLQFVSSSSSARLPVAFEVLPFVPLIELSPYAGPPGSTVTFYGRGFAPDETVHVYRQDDQGRREMATLRADAEGAFREAGAIVVAADDAAKIITFTLEGEESRAPVSQRFGLLDLAPWAGLSQYSGPSGTQIRFFGKGFAASELVDITAGDDRVATAQADAQGQFDAGSFAIPAGAQGEIRYQFRGQNSKGEASATFTVTGS